MRRLVKRRRYAQELKSRLTCPTVRNSLVAAVDDVLWCRLIDELDEPPGFFYELLYSAIGEEVAMRMSKEAGTALIHELDSTNSNGAIRTMAAVTAIEIRCRTRDMFMSRVVDSFELVAEPVWIATDSVAYFSLLTPGTGVFYA